MREAFNSAREKIDGIFTEEQKGWFQALLFTGSPTLFFSPSVTNPTAADTTEDSVVAMDETGPSRTHEDSDNSLLSRCFAFWPEQCERVIHNDNINENNNNGQRLGKSKTE